MWAQSDNSSSPSVEKKKKLNGNYLSGKGGTLGDF
jgi:hypothetical protein